MAEAELSEREQAAVAGLQAFLVRHGTAQFDVTPEGNVYVFRSADGGLRVSEFGYTWRHANGLAGASWMRSSAECLGAICAAEDFLLDYGREVEEHDQDSYYDPAQEAERALLFHLFNEDWKRLPEWEDRRNGSEDQ